MASTKNFIFKIGGTAMIVVANYSALPDPTTVSGKFYWVSNSQGTSWLPGNLGGTYYNSGTYYSNGTTWEFLNVPYQATQLEVNDGTNNDKFITPLTLKNSFDLKVPDATSSTKGKMKLFADLLNSYTDGSVTQAAIVAALAGKANKRTLITLTSDKSLTSTTSLQAMFNAAVDVVAGEYIFSLEYRMSSLAASGGMFFGTLGTAGVTSINWVSNGNKQASFPATNQIQTGNVTTAVQICGSSTGTNGIIVVTGRVVFSSAGTFFPSVGFTTAPTSGIGETGNSLSIIKVD